MTDKEKAERILAFIQRETDESHRQYTDAIAAVAAQSAGRDEWMHHNPDDGVGGPSGCPYNVEQARRNLKLREDYWRNMEELKAFAISRFII